MHRSPHSISSSQSPTDTHDRERVQHRRTRQQSLSPPALSARSQQGPPTALPSIHHLHPDLPPPHAHRHAAPAQYSPSEFLPGASYGSSAFFAGSQPSSSALASSYPPPSYDERRMSFDRPPPASRPQPSSSSYPEQRMSPPEAESDPDQNESERGPPKKKRRRQALSCTECKRRKIKCDRTHPCGPCARRGEPEKCQWHVIEPVDKYVTRSEWDELYTRYRVLEDRCIRLEKLVVQLHPEITEQSQYEIATGHPTALPSPTAPRPAAMRAYSLAGPGISGAGGNSGAVSQRVRPNTPLSALPGPGPGPAHGPGPGTGTSAFPVGTSTGAESSESTRSGSAPPPMLATAQTALPHPPPHSDRRTCASGSHASFAAPSERLVPHQVPGATTTMTTTRVRPFTAPSSHSYTFPPPPPPPENPPVYLPSRSHSGFMHGRSTAGPESSNVSSPGAYGTRPSGQPYPSPLSSLGGGRHMHPDNTALDPENDDADVRYAQRYDRESRHERSMAYEPLPLPPRRRRSDSKNGEAQTSKAGDALRQRWSASPACDETGRPRSLRHPVPNSGPASAASASALNSILIPSAVYARSDDSAPSSPRFDSSEASTSSRKRARRGSLYLSIPSCGSAPGTPPPALVVH